MRKNACLGLWVMVWLVVLSIRPCRCLGRFCVRGVKLSGGCLWPFSSSARTRFL